MTLESLGYCVIKAESGKQTITLLNKGEHPMPFTLIITDIRMPHLHGVEAMDDFPRNYPSIPLIVLTGFPDLARGRNLIKRGVTNY